MREDVLGNTLASHEKVAYIVGNDYEILSCLSRVLTIKQFTVAVLEQRLPLHRLWIVGQGIGHEGLQFLRLCETYLQGVRFHFGSQNLLIPDLGFLAESPSADYVVSTDPKESTEKTTKNLEWHNFHFMDATRVQAELKVQLPESLFLAQDFLFTAARELSERACQSALPNGVLVIKQASFQCFHRLFPLPIMVETQFQLVHDNKRSLKSLTRFYQDFSCTAEVSMSFDLYSSEQAKEFYQNLAGKTVEHFSIKIEEDI